MEIYKIHVYLEGSFYVEKERPIIPYIRSWMWSLRQLMERNQLITWQRPWVLIGLL